MASQTTDAGRIEAALRLAREHGRNADGSYESWLVRRMVEELAGGQIQPGQPEPAAAADEIDFDLADRIEAAMAAAPADRYWLPSELEKKTGGDRQAVRQVLAYMIREHYVTSNGRGGCWERFRSLAYRPFGDSR